MSDLLEFDLSNEEYREVIFVESGMKYRIDNPVKLVLRRGGSTQRVVDAQGVVHCYAGPLSGKTVIVWKPRAGAPEVSF